MLEPSFLMVSGVKGCDMAVQNADALYCNEMLRHLGTFVTFFWGGMPISKICTHCFGHDDPKEPFLKKPYSLTFSHGAGSERDRAR